MNATAAAVRAGYSAKSAAHVGHHLVNAPHIQEMVDALKAERAERVQVTADDVLAELKRIASADIGAVFNELGGVKALHEIPPEVRAAIASYEPGEYGVKVKFWDKPRALELIGKHLKLFTDKVEHSGSIESLTDEQLEAKYRVLIAAGTATLAAASGDEQ